MTANRGVFPIASVKLGISRRADFAADPQERAERIERVEAPVKAERELVEIGLQVLRADAVVAPLEPGFQVAENKVNDRQVRFGHGRIVRFDNRQMLIAQAAQARVARRGVGDNHRAGQHRRLDEASQRQPTAIRRDFHTKPPGVAALASGRRLNATLGCALPDFDGGNHKRLIVNAFTAASRISADPRLVNLDMAPGRTDLVAIRAHHSGPQLVEDLERRLIAGQPELTLKLRRAHSRRMAGDKVRGPEPHAQRRARVLHHRPRRQSDIATALPATPHLGPVGETERLACRAAVRAGKAVLPADALQVGRARRIVREKPLKLRQGARELQLGMVEDVGGHGLGFRLFFKCCQGFKTHVNGRLSSLDPGSDEEQNRDVGCSVASNAPFRDQAILFGREWAHELRAPLVGLGGHLHILPTAKCALSNRYPLIACFQSDARKQRRDRKRVIAVEVSASKLFVHLFFFVTRPACGPDVTSPSRGSQSAVSQRAGSAWGSLSAAARNKSASEAPRTVTLPRPSSLTA